MKTTSIKTSFGNLSVLDSEAEGPALLLIHGNSSCKEIFRHQFESALATKYRLIALDLPGHGASQDALDPENTYHFQGYAKTALEVLEALKADPCALYGWSLGGHIAIEMAGMDPSFAGLMISGTPPLGIVDGELQTGFLPSDQMDLTGKEDFSEEDVALYASSTCGNDTPVEPFMVDAVRRTDGRARRIMLESFAVGLKERDIVMTAKMPLAIVNGDPEPFVDNAYLKTIPYANLWEGKIHLLPGIGHAPFWEEPETFHTLLARFLGDVFA